MKNLVVVGGSNGLGASFVNLLSDKFSNVYIIDRVKPIVSFNNTTYIKFDLLSDNFCEIKSFIKNADSLVITAGIGNVKSFGDLDEKEIENTINVNLTSVAKILNGYFSELLKKDNRECLVIGSIAGDIAPPLFSVYGSSKAGVNMLCESLNCELRKSESTNRITCIKPLSIKGTSFTGGKTDLASLKEMTNLFIDAMQNKVESMYYDEPTCNKIIKKYAENPAKFADESFDYKVENGRIQKERKTRIGYLSGTFDLFHIGHLNILKKAKQYCDYLIVGVHESGSWKGKETFIPFEERVEILKSIKYVDRVVKSHTEDSDAWDELHFDYLFVGSDYKGSERFNRYEKLLKNKAEIIYFDYTKSTSSTQIRDLIKKEK